MGYNTTVVVLNDALDSIASDPDFGRKLATEIRQSSFRPSTPNEVPAGGFCNAASVIESHHSSGEVAVVVGHNTGRVQTPDELRRARDEGYEAGREDERKREARRQENWLQVLAQLDHLSAEVAEALHEQDRDAMFKRAAAVVNEIDAYLVKLGFGPEDSRLRRAREKVCVRRRKQVGDPEGHIDMLVAAIFGVRLDQAEYHSINQAIDEARRLRERVKRASQIGSGLPPSARLAVQFLLTRIGSWTSARWDQHLRHEVGDEAANAAIRWIEEVFDVAGYGAERVAKAACTCWSEHGYVGSGQCPKHARLTCSVSASADRECIHGTKGCTALHHARPGTSEAAGSLVEVRDLYGQGTGPWRLFVNGVGVADWPTIRACEPKEYAEEVARCIRSALEPGGGTP